MNKDRVLNKDCSENVSSFFLFMNKMHIQYL